MGWRGNYDMTVSKVTHTDWTFLLRGKRELLIGYRIWSSREREVLDGHRWVWFTGALPQYGEVEILAQWLDHRKGTPREGDRAWHWVHWRNRGSDAVVEPWAVLVPPPQGYFHDSQPETQKRDLWILVERATPIAVGATLATAAGSSGGGSSGKRVAARGWTTAVAVRPLPGQTLQQVRTTRNLRNLSTNNLWAHAARLLKPSRPAGRSSS